MNHPLLPLLGGTFDPVHHGHLRCALEIAEWLDTRVCLLPSGQPAHRGAPGASAEHRLAMLDAAIAGVPGLQRDDRELRRGGDTYSIDTLRALRAERPDVAPCFIVGADAFAGLPRWREWRALLDLTHFIVVTRPGHPLKLPVELRAWAEDARTVDASDLRSSAGGLLIERSVTALEISATAIRSTVAGGGDPAFLVPGAVRRYIADHGLYRA